MPLSPHPIEITVNDTDNSTKVEGAKVYVKNVTKRSESTEETTNSNGIASIDLANLPLTPGQSVEYELGDTILIITYTQNYHDAVLYTVAGGSKSQTLNLNPVKHEKASKEVIKTIVVSNTSSTVYYARVLSSQDARVLLHIECPANDSRGYHLDGLACQNGVLIERENNALIVTAVLK